MTMPTKPPTKRKGNNHKWKGLYGIDRKYTTRVDNLAYRKAEADAQQKEQSNG